jgi:hypothetical protein
MHFVPSEGMMALIRCGATPTTITEEEIPDYCVKLISRVTGIKISVEEMAIEWAWLPKKHYKNYKGPGECFQAGGVLAWKYVPKMCIPGGRWRLHVTQPSHEVSAAFQRIRVNRRGFLTVRERLTRWGLVLHIGSRIREFLNSYSGRQDEWHHVLQILDVREEDIHTMLAFTSTMRLLNPVDDSIPIRVLEVMTVFRVLFRLSLKHFELASEDCV